MVAILGGLLCEGEREKKDNSDFSMDIWFHLRYHSHPEWPVDTDKFLVTKQDPPHKNIGIELPLGQILESFVTSESRTSLANMAILTKIWNIG